MNPEESSASPDYGVSRIYALYRGDKLIGIGTKTELADAHGVKPETIYFYSTPSYKKRFKNDSRRLVAVRLNG